MIKTLNKIFLYLAIILILIIFYLSFFGINTKKFNNKINDAVLNINPKINLDLKDVNILLNPLNFSIKIKTLEPEILFEDTKLKLKHLKTNISLKSLINKNFLIDDINISTKNILLKNLISLARSFENSTELFILEKIVKEGVLIGEMNLNFDSEGKLKDDYQIKKKKKNGRIGFFNKYDVKNLNLYFTIEKNKYLLNEIKTSFNEISLFFPLIEIIEKKDLFFIKGEGSIKKNNLDTEALKLIFKGLDKDLNIKDINFSSNNNFSLKLNKKFKMKDLKIESKINLKNLDFNKSLKSIKSYLPNYNDKIRLESHKISINYQKNELNIKGKGQILIEGKKDNIEYKIDKKKDDYVFELETNLKENIFLFSALDYSKDEGVNGKLELSGLYKKNKELKFKSISLFDENKNSFIIQGLNLNKEFRITKIEKLIFDFINNNKIKNNFLLMKKNKDYSIVGKSFDATKLINELLTDNNSKSTSVFSGLNSNININIDKTYLDNTIYVNYLTGSINFKENKIDKLNLDSSFPNKKKLTLTIKKNKNNEKVTTLFSDYPKPLVSQYKFIKGFEEGVLDFSSNEKNGISNSVLKIDNFKVKEVPVLAKLLTLASLQGIADLLTGEGIRFTDLEMKFSNEKELMKIDEMYAIGPAISILLDGYIENKKLVSLRGTLVPATTINRTISSIPIIGKILVGKKSGEGIFGVSFKIKGTPKKLKTTVNPIKTLTPRFITRTLEKIKKN